MIEYVNVSKLYGNVVALDNISFEIEEGEFTFLIGPSGSGKSTIIKLLIKEENPSEGSIYFYEHDITKLSSSDTYKLRREIGVVFQDFKLLPHKNLYENIAFALEVSNRKNSDIEETVFYVLELIGLKERYSSFPNELSGGEKQKVAIARAIANNPKVLIADEPTGNLDPQSSWEVISLLQKINQWGTTVIMATHGTDIVNTLGKRVIALDKGRIISDNKKGVYSSDIIPITIPKLSKSKTKPSLKTPENLKLDKSKLKPDKKFKSKKKSLKKKSEEKEFEITFTTKNKNPKQKRKRGKDVVDLYKLDLPIKLEEKLIATGLSTIEKLKKATEDKAPF